MRLSEIHCDDDALEEVRRKLAGVYDSRPCEMRDPTNCSRDDEIVCPLRHAVDCPKRLRNETATDRDRRRRDREARELADAKVCRIPERVWGILGIGAAIPMLRQTAAVAECRRHRKGTLVLMGPPGSGKTVAAAWWAWDQRGSFWRSEEVQGFNWFDRAAVGQVTDSAALVLDDLGSEYDDTKGNWRTHLDAIFNRRYDANLPTIVTTNLPAASLRSLLGDRVWRRIDETGRLFVCANADDQETLAGVAT